MTTTTSHATARTPAADYMIPLLSLPMTSHHRAFCAGPASGSDNRESSGGLSRSSSSSCSCSSSSSISCVLPGDKFLPEDNGSEEVDEDDGGLCGDSSPASGGALPSLCNYLDPTTPEGKLLQNLPSGEHIFVSL